MTSVALAIAVEGSLSHPLSLSPPSSPLSPLSFSPLSPLSLFPPSSPTYPPPSSPLAESASPLKAQENVLEECPVCYSEMELSNKFKINGCGHAVCLSCEPDIRSRFQTRDRENLLNVLKCPLCRQPEIPSAQQLKDEIRSLKASIETYRDRIYSLSYQRAPAQRAPAPAQRAPAPAPRATGPPAPPLPLPIATLGVGWTYPARFAELPPGMQRWYRSLPGQPPAGQRPPIQDRELVDQRQQRQQRPELQRCAGICSAQRNRTRFRCATAGCGVACCKRCKKCQRCQPRAAAAAPVQAQAPGV